MYYQRLRRNKANIHMKHFLQKTTTTTTTTTTTKHLSKTKKVNID